MENNEELHQCYKSPNIITIQDTRLRWPGNGKLMNENGLARGVMHCKPEGVRSRG